VQFFFGKGVANRVRWVAKLAGLSPGFSPISEYLSNQLDMHIFVSRHGSKFAWFFFTVLVLRLQSDVSLLVDADRGRTENFSSEQWK